VFGSSPFPWCLPFVGSYPAMVDIVTSSLAIGSLAARLEASASSASS